MEAPERGALTLVRLIGVMLVVAAMLEVGLYLAECHAPKHPQPVALMPVLLRSLWAVLGIVMLAKARAIAEWISEPAGPIIKPPARHARLSLTRPARAPALCAASGA